MRRLYLSYIIFLASMYILIEGFSFGTQLFYSFKHAEDSFDGGAKFQLFGRGKAVQICMAGIIVVGVMMLSTLLSKGVEFLLLVWKKEHYSEISRRVLTFLALAPEYAKYQLLDLFIQFFIVLYLEILPLFCALVVLIVNISTNLTQGINAMFSFGSLSALSIIVVWWLFSIIANYKRLFLFCLRRGKRFYRRVDRITEAPGSHKRRIFLPNDVIIDSVEDEITPPPHVDNLSRQEAVKAVLRAQRDLFVMLYIHLWWKHLCHIPIPFHFVRRLMFNQRPSIPIRPKHVWMGLLALILIALVLSTTIFNAWKIFTVSSVAISCCVIDFIVNRIIFIPQHNPSRERLRATWAIEGRSFLLHRFIAVFEEVYFLSPSTVYGVAKMGVYGTLLLITVCLLFQFYNGMSVFLVPLLLSLYVVILYALRFNVGRVRNAFRRVRRSIGSSDFSEWLATSGLNLSPADEETALIGGGSSGSPSLAAIDSSVETPTRSRSSSHVIRTHLTRALLGLAADDDSRSDASESEIDVRLRKHLHVHHEVEFLRLVSVFTVVLLVLFGSFSLFVLNWITLGAFPALIFLLALSSISFGIFKRYEINTAPIWNAFFYFFVIFIGALFIMGSIEPERSFERGYAKRGPYIEPEFPRYAVCGKTWEGFNIVDYGLFAHLAYEHEPFAAEDLQVWFPDIVNEVYTLTFHNSTGGLVFFDLHMPARNLSIVSVRGTDNFRDVIQDLFIWKEIVFLQIASIFGPFSNFWPTSLSIEIVNAISSLEAWTFAQYSYDESSYYNALDNYLTEISDRRTVLVGHSLGGGVSKVVAAKHNTNVVTFSAPGIVMISKKVGLTLEQINRISMNIKPTNDIIPSIDSLGGLTQEIDCNQPNFLECHRLVHTVNTLMKSCGNDGRYIDE